MSEGSTPSVEVIRPLTESNAGGEVISYLVNYLSPRFIIPWYYNVISAELNLSSSRLRKHIEH